MPDLDPQKQREFAIDVVRRLRARGYESLWAGGCVRDDLLGREPKDYDVATDARPEQIREVFGARRTLAVGAAFGVIIVRGLREAGSIDVATFRQDATYRDGRHPDGVTFSDAEHDASRRDFTINGLFYDPLAQQVIDYVGGQQDLHDRILRTIGDATQRLAEDKLRMLRAVRFAATLDFTLNGPTRDAIRAMADQITQISAERIAQELRRMFASPHHGPAADLLAETGLLAAVLPEAEGDDWPHRRAVLGQLRETSFSLTTAALIRDDLPRKSVEAICRRLRLATKETERIAWLAAHRDALRGARDAHWPALQRLLIRDGAGELLALHEARVRAEGGDLRDVEHCRRLLALPAEELNPPPLLTGDDLVAHGVPRGREYKHLLDAVRDAQLEGQVDNKPAAIELVDRLRGE